VRPARTKGQAQHHLDKGIVMSKPKQWKQGRELKHADAWDVDERVNIDDQVRVLSDAYPQEAEPDGRLWVGSGDAS
jgi:hypothetical protein